MKGSGKPDDRKGQVRFEAAGAGDGFTVRLVRHRQTKGAATDKLHLRDTAPVLDPTGEEKIGALLYGPEGGRVRIIVRRFGGVYHRPDNLNYVL